MTENDYKINYMISYGLGHTLHVRFMRNLHNNIVVEEATYYNADGGVMYVYHDDKKLGRTIEVHNMYIPQEYWKDAELLPLRTTYYKYQTIDVESYALCDIWELEGLIIESVEQSTFPRLLLSNGSIYVVLAHVFNIISFLNAVICTVEIVQKKHGHYLRIITSKGAIEINRNSSYLESEQWVDEVKEITISQETNLKLYDSLKGEFISNGTIVL